MSSFTSSSSLSTWVVFVTVCHLAGLLIDSPAVTHGLSAQTLCRSFQNLNSVQTRICMAHPLLMVSIGKGLSAAREECTRQFRWRRWNCQNSIGQQFWMDGVGHRSRNRLVQHVPVKSDDDSEEETDHDRLSSPSVWTKDNEIESHDNLDSDKRHLDYDKIEENKNSNKRHRKRKKKKREGHGHGDRNGHGHGNGHHATNTTSDISSTTGFSSSMSSRRRVSLSSANNRIKPISLTLERSFLTAVISSGVTHAIAQACARGNLTTCGCSSLSHHGHHDDVGSLTSTMSTSHHEYQHDQGHVKHSLESRWRWGGCSVDLAYALKLSRRFLQQDHHHHGKGQKAHGGQVHHDHHRNSLMGAVDAHNLRLGRKAISVTMFRQCKCHGVSGSCTLRTCWTRLGTMRRIGDWLMMAYQSRPTRVSIVNNTTDTLRVQVQKPLTNATFIEEMTVTNVNESAIVNEAYATFPSDLESPTKTDTNNASTLVDTRQSSPGGQTGQVVVVLVPFSEKHNPNAGWSSKVSHQSLVYADVSPNYCEPDEHVNRFRGRGHIFVDTSVTTTFSGTKGRRCLVHNNYASGDEHLTLSSESSFYYSSPPRQKSTNKTRSGGIPPTSQPDKTVHSNFNEDDQSSNKNLVNLANEYSMMQMYQNDPSDLGSIDDESSTHIFSSLDQSSCSIMCCGRGYGTHQFVRKWKCACKFKWCCQVECQQCQENVNFFTCN